MASSPCPKTVGIQFCVTLMWGMWTQNSRNRARDEFPGKQLLLSGFDPKHFPK